MLKNAKVEAMVTRLRSYAEQQTFELARLALEPIRHTLKYVADERLKLAASREARAWLRATKGLLPPGDHVLAEIEQDLAQTLATDFVDRFVDESTKTNQSGPQEADSQSENPENKLSAAAHFSIPIPEHDELEDGTPAFDLRQQPRKPVQPKPEPIQINVVDFLGSPDEPTYGKPFGYQPPTSGD